MTLSLPEPASPNDPAPGWQWLCNRITQPERIARFFNKLGADPSIRWYHRAIVELSVLIDKVFDSSLLSLCCCRLVVLARQAPEMCRLVGGVYLASPSARLRNSLGDFPVNFLNVRANTAGFS